MKKTVISIFLTLVATGCAHQQTTSTTVTGQLGSPIPATDPVDAKEDQAIQKLPGPPPALNSPSLSIGQIPMEVNPEVENWINYFQGRGRSYFERYLERSTRYVPIMKQILKENGVPEDLIYIAMIESGFSGKIKSRAKAVGFWQFIGGTGKHYGLTVNRLMDERYDPVKSTEAAANYFKGLYNLFGDWFLAIASYNVGENRIKSMVMKNYTRNFWELAKRKQLPAETTQYIPKFLAAELIAREPEKYGFSGLNYEAAMEFDTVTSKDALDMRELARSLKIDYEELRELNMAYKTQYIPVIGDVATVRVPKGTGEAAKVALSDAVVKNKRVLATAEPVSKSSVMKYKVKKGETLEAIATRFDVTVTDLVKANRIRHGRVRPGMKLKIPVSALTAPTEKEKRSVASTSKSTNKAKRKYYVVKSGDTLSRIAKSNGVSVSTLKKSNKLASNGKVMRGQKLVIPQSSGRAS
jgi:membrane-bound lytic murein transglycosylase D